MFHWTISFCDHSPLGNSFLTFFSLVHPSKCIFSCLCCVFSAYSFLSSFWINIHKASLHAHNLHAGDHQIRTLFKWSAFAPSALNTKEKKEVRRLRKTFLEGKLSFCSLSILLLDFSFELKQHISEKSLKNNNDVDVEDDKGNNNNNNFEKDEKK